MAIRADLNSADGPELLNQELKALHGGERASYWVRVLDASRRVVAETPGMNRLLPVKLFSPEQTSPLTELNAQRLSNRREIILVSLSRDRSKRAALHDSGGAGSHGR